MEKRIAAFFDIDGTLYREGLITEVFKKLIKSELIENDKWYKEVKPFYVKWDKRIGNYDNYLLKMADIYSEAIIGLHRTQIEFIASQIIKQKGDRVYTYTRDRIKWHKDQGHLIITISGSPIELVREMSIKYGFDDYIGTKYLLNENDVYTGKIIPMWDSASKQTAIETFVGKYDIDLQQSYAYGDTSGDYTMLKSISNPTAINPTKELLLMILNDDELKEKINIMIERKDVVYKLHPEHIEI
ncbi:HAD-IB family hydrolase [Clostridium tagluense]|uniref:HAD-IB family hydrolase n=1 Tax=Clostridium tagluense TaxID=360422 RepID=UPI001CF27B2D|nr:HAD-IB family hydrolase [Clostridium tagluense]MCB2311777.1 HAD-IB family hydrolase [Clostridium tagluense]MCB2316501.1 HAD-IB family hydrolase [Clostridium tagluense]MCB2321357.1 HAD-IB family hydrolase [Clostridium tagluense]MCB2326370.1 HAD-IB family hydrolase [Clostridium tagluense]MCB2331093.1 HAD-IB family hydrolase [Clostridium tagluense]